MSGANQDNKAVFMKRLREALGHPGDQRRQAPPGLFPDAPSEESLARLAGIRDRSPADSRALIQTLMAAAAPINLAVQVVASLGEATQAIAAEVIAASPEWGTHRQVCAWDHPLVDAAGLSSLLAEQNIPVVTCGSLTPTDGRAISDDERAALRRAVIDSYVGITSADFCVADTATLVLRTRPGQPRSVSLVPSRHIAVITVDRLLADFKELYASIRWEDPSRPANLTTCMTFISGPSKTADIEATLVHGAHGPRAVSLYVIAPL